MNLRDLMRLKTAIKQMDLPNTALALILITKYVLSNMDKNCVDARSILTDFEKDLSNFYKEI